MEKPLALAAACALALFPAMDGWCATEGEIADIRAQLNELRETYEARLRALERKLNEAEARAPATTAAATPPPAAASAATPPPAAASAATPPPAVATTPATAARAAVAAGSAAFNPAISVVLQGTYANLTADPAGYRIAGFVPGGEIGPPRRSFSLAESELNLSASVDNLFSGTLIFALTPEDTVEVEEAYGIYTAAPHGLAPKFGRFYSGLGYLNEQHQHAWDFYDAPLAYQAFLGGQYRNDGLQLKWVAPTDLYVEAGAEIGSGAAFPGNDRNRNGIGNGVAYVHVGGDVGASQTWRAGLSYLRTGAATRSHVQDDLGGSPADVAFTGRSELVVADFVWKWAPQGNARERSAKLQGEYFRRRETGSLDYVSADGGVAQSAPYLSTQSGFYVQGVYQFAPAWRAGVRYDRLYGGSVDFGANGAYLGQPAFDPQRAAVMVDWTPTEFSRLRLQYQRSKLVPDRTDGEFYLQYILTLGAHGAHRY